MSEQRPLGPNVTGLFGATQRTKLDYEMYMYLSWSVQHHKQTDSPTGTMFANALCAMPDNLSPNHKTPKKQNVICLYSKAERIRVTA